MIYRTLGTSNLRTSVIGLGALHFGTFVPEVQCVDLIQRARELGVNFIDTAPMYGNSQSEIIVGNAIRGRREDFIIGTKVGLIPIINAEGQFGVRRSKLTSTAIRESVDNSLKNLGTDYIDLLQLHSFDDSTDPDETFTALQDLVKAGKILHIGASNYDYSQLKTMVAANNRSGYPRLCALQSHYNIMERRLETEVIPFCLDNSIGLICYRALGRGIISNKYSRDVQPPLGSRAEMSPRVRRQLNEHVFDTLAVLNTFVSERNGLTVASLAVKWLSSKSEVSSIVLGIRNRQQLDEVIRATEYPLTSQDFEDLDSAIHIARCLELIKSSPETFLET